MKYLLALLLLATPACADTLTLSGTLTGLPKENIFYDFSITSIFLNQFGGEVEDSLSGSYLITTKSGTPLASQTLSGSLNEFIFQAVNDSIVLQEFAVFKPNTDPYVTPELVAKYDFLATGLDKVQIVFIRGSDPLVVRTIGTPEPETWVLILIAIVIAGGIMGWRWLQPRPVPPPVILTAYGPVTESARRQAEINMKLDPDLKRRVEETLCKQYGNIAEGLAAARRNYPGAYDED